MAGERMGLRPRKIWTAMEAVRIAVVTGGVFSVSLRWRDEQKHRAAEAAMRAGWLRKRRGIHQGHFDFDVTPAGRAALARDRADDRRETDRVG